MSHFNLLLFSLLCFGALNILLFIEHEALPDGKTHVHILDVGQGDSILIGSPSGKQILIDGGPDLSVLEQIGNFVSYFDRSIDLLVLTHPDSDHITGLPELLKRYKIDAVLLTGIDHFSNRYQSLVDLLKGQNIAVLFPDPDIDIAMGDGLILDIVSPANSDLSDGKLDSNDTSIVIRAIDNNESILLTGDIEHIQEHAILKSGRKIDSTFIKVPHHGSRTSSSTGFLLAVNPQQALVSAAGNNHALNHPHIDIVGRYAQLGIPLMGTHEHGNLSITLSNR